MKWYQRILATIDGADLLILGGLGMLGSGLYMISPVVMLIVVGLILLSLGLLGAYRKGNE